MKGGENKESRPKRRLSLFRGPSSWRRRSDDDFVDLLLGHNAIFLLGGVAPRVKPEGVKSLTKVLLKSY